ncbi:hypothetical protein [Maricaulis sp. CAU 1757]
MFNDVVFDLGDIHSVLRSGVIPLSPAQIENLTAAQLNSLVRETVFMDANIAHSKPEHVRHLAALICQVAPGANALLAVAPSGAESWTEVGLRYAQLPITTLAYLWGEQQLGRLNASRVNQAVWLAGQSGSNDSENLPQATGTG